MISKFKFYCSCVKMRQTTLSTGSEGRVFQLWIGLGSGIGICLVWVVLRYWNISPERSEGEINIISEPAMTTAAAALVATRQRAE